MKEHNAQSRKGGPAAADESVPAVDPAHALQDHAGGEALTHAHAPGVEYDHDHDDFEAYGPLEENPIWIQDHVTLTSVGIDIGSSGTQVIFSRVNLRRLGEALTSQYFVVSRETLFQSPVALTPYESEQRIDQRALGAIIDEAYNLSGVSPDAVDTGAVILTGEALRRENAEQISRIVAERGGDFVCAAAGHHMEAMLAAYGSGAARVSSDTGKRLLTSTLAAARPNSRSSRPDVSWPRRRFMSAVACRSSLLTTVSRDSIPPVSTWQPLLVSPGRWVT